MYYIIGFFLSIYSFFVFLFFLSFKFDDNECNFKNFRVIDFFVVVKKLLYFVIKIFVKL